MILNYFLIGVWVTTLAVLGVVWILFPKAILKWAGTVLLPLFFWPIVRLSKLLGMETKPFYGKPSARVILITRVMGIGYILVALLFLAAALGFFK